MKLAQKVNSMLMKKKHTPNDGASAEQGNHHEEQPPTPNKQSTPAADTEPSRGKDKDAHQSATDDKSALAVPAKQGTQNSGAASPRRPLLTEVAWVSAQEGMLGLYSATGWLSRYFALKGDVLRYFESSPTETKGLPVRSLFIILFTPFW